MSKSYLFLISAAIALATIGPISGAVLCVKHDEGALTVREVCKANETRVDPAALGLQGPPGPAVTVRDGNGKFVGLLFDPVLGRVARRVADQTVLLDVGEAGFREFFSQIYFVYGTVDCSGDAFFPPNPGITDATLTRRALVILTRQAAYFPAGPLATRTIQSYLQFPQDPDYCAQTWGTFILPDGCCRLLDAGDMPVWSVGSLELGQFVPPFHAEGP